MSHFTLQLEPQGPVLNAAVLVSAPRAAALKAAGEAIPSPVQIRGLVDTGASCTCVDPDVLAQLNLTPTGSVLMCTPSTGNVPHQTEQYDVGLFIPGSAQSSVPLILETVPVVASQLEKQQGFHALIGRDILSLCLLVYNGLTGSFTLAF